MTPDLSGPAAPLPAAGTFAAPLAAAAADALAQGNLSLADLLCRSVLDHDPDEPDALALLGRLASTMGRFELAAGYCARAAARRPDAVDVARARDAALAAAEERRRRPPATGRDPRVLLIKAWGYGFWADVDHVAGQLLVADITGRIPVVRWGRDSLFSSPHFENAFERYFLPVSEYAFDDVIKPGATFFPLKWRYDNLFEEQIQRWEGPYSRLTGLHFFGRDEDVVVSDFHTYVNDLIPWLDPASPYYGLGRDEVYRRLFAQKLRLKPHLETAIERFWRKHMAKRRWLAVHVRGSDKVEEVPHLAAINASYFARVDAILGADPGLSLFLLTDSEPILAEYRQRYGKRLFHTDCTRTATATGVQTSGHPGQRIADEVILDTYVAARCDCFLGNGTSNVSTTIRHLKAWAPGTYTLIEADALSVRRISMYQR